VGSWLICLSSGTAPVEYRDLVGGSPQQAGVKKWSLYSRLIASRSLLPQEGY
jgi:hypothetical protein